MNRHYKKLRAIISLTTDGGEGLNDFIMQMMIDAGTPVAKSKIQGWGLGEDHKNYRRMTADEFYDVLDAFYRFLNKNEQQ